MVVVYVEIEPHRILLVWTTICEPRLGILIQVKIALGGRRCDQSTTESFRLPLLPARNAAHIGQMVRNALVAIDAGLFAREQEALVRAAGAWRLLGAVH